MAQPWFSPLRTALAAAALCITAAGSLAAQLRFQPIYHVGEFDSPEEQVFDGHFSTALTPAGAIFVGDYGTREIRHFDARGRFVRAFGRKGQGPGEFEQPGWLALGPSADSLYVYDPVLHRVTVFTTSGVLARTVRVPLEKTGLLGMYLHPRGYLLFTGGVANRPELVHLVDLSGRHVRSIGALLRTADVRVSPAVSGVVRSQLSEGRVVTLPGGDVLVALAAPYRLARYGLDGRVRWTIEDPVIRNPIGTGIVASPSEYRVGAYPRVTALHVLDANRVAVLYADFERARRMVDVRSTRDGRLLSRTTLPSESHVSQLLPRASGGGLALLTRSEPFPRLFVSRWSLP